MGASNLAARRAAKANRRKAIVAQKRKAETLMGTLPGQVARGAALPIRCCLIGENLFEIGMGTLMLARGATVGPLVLGVFLLDTFCLGVKDVMLRTIDGAQLDHWVDRMGEATPLVPVDPSYACKLLRDLTRWSASLGFQPHREFAAAERLFGTVDPQTCATEFAFGMNGKPFYISGPTESPSSARQHVERLRERLGLDDSDYMIPV